MFSGVSVVETLDHPPFLFPGVFPVDRRRDYVPLLVIVTAPQEIEEDPEGLELLMECGV